MSNESTKLNAFWERYCPGDFVSNLSENYSPLHFTPSHTREKTWKTAE